MARILEGGVEVGEGVSAEEGGGEEEEEEGGGVGEEGEGEDGGRREELGISGGEDVEDDRANGERGEELGGREEKEEEEEDGKEAEAESAFVAEVHLGKEEVKASRESGSKTREEGRSMQVNKIQQAEEVGTGMRRIWTVGLIWTSPSRRIRVWKHRRNKAI